jgi:hypothetical protein
LRQEALLGTAFHGALGGIGHNPTEVNPRLFPHLERKMTIPNHPRRGFKITLSQERHPAAIATEQAPQIKTFKP